MWNTPCSTNEPALCLCGVADMEHLLRFPAVSTGERFGVIRTFRRFPAGVLEDQRHHAVSQPRFWNLLLVGL